MKAKRLRICPECSTTLERKHRGRLGLVECPKCGFKQEYKRRQRVRFIRGVDDDKNSL